MSHRNYFIGLMSGTSLDGVDAVLVDLSDTSPKLLATFSHPIAKQLQATLQSTIQPNWKGSLESIGILHQQLGYLFSEAVTQLLKKSTFQPNQIQAIGSHGQTLWHKPLGEYPFSLQLGDANIIAERTGITTIADFRSRDIAAGGQGAPLVPAFHKATLSHSVNHRIILNIGGIANISVLPSIDSNKEVLGFDTGPGNGLIDAWIMQCKNINYDAHGDWARSGKIIPLVLEKLLSDPYFSLAYPKSTGKEAFNLLWLNNKLGDHLQHNKPEDIQATLTELTALSIAEHIKSITSIEPCNEIYVCGGGIHNDFLIERLQLHLSQSLIASTAKLGIDPDWMEAIAFAWLAKQTIEGKPSNLPVATGAKGLRILGAVYHA